MLNIPNELQNSANQLLPELNKDVLNKLAVYGWQQVGIMVAIIDSAGGMLMLNHRVSAKCPRNILGPLGETTQQTKQSIEQPAATLLRGFKEELDLTPNHNSMYIPTANGWHINAWPSHKKIAGFSAAISFPVFIEDSLRNQIINNTVTTTEISGIRRFMHPEEVLTINDCNLRPGVKTWLNELLMHSCLSIDQDLKILPNQTPLPHNQGQDIWLNDGSYAA